MADADWPRHSLQYNFGGVRPILASTACTAGVHTPAVGRGLGELLLQRRYQALDLSWLGYHLIRDGIPLRNEVLMH